ncbi:MAG TPA: FlgD immunoglobulin-like domain containing protein [Candidatus Krumholzibacteria bacterium]|nr:FlgD immunoglobulin-like domain containing protein [Candidatus Krumholzibacteria bacterium]HPD73077.1 FlgD immunoglobulin-like domain containing protein [Candidatus Krumholzibacteria bacterium]HRY41877.1 FlgD immunoglobulin-like domain containing protein [Candidatus Krumholzibacteria bacterium]
MVRLAHPLLACILAIAGPVAAGIIVEPVSDGAADCDQPAVGLSPGGETIVAWQDANLQVWTAGCPTFPPGTSGARDPQNHGYGTSPRVVWTWQGLMLVWASGTGIKYNVAYGTEFIDPPRYVETWISHAETVLDVRGVAQPGWDVAWIVFEAASVNQGQVVLLLRITKGGPEELALIAEGLATPVRPQLSDVPDPYQPLPRVYYLRDDVRLAYRTEQPDGEWLAEMLVPHLDYGVECDADAAATGAQGILSLGPQPTCPCNVIHATLQDAEGVWRDLEPLTVPYFDYDWPQSPCIRLDAQGQTHAFWTQLGSGPDLQPHRRDLEYWVRNADGWTDRGQDLDLYEDAGLGSRVAMDLTTGGQPVFAWTVKDTVAGVPQPRRIMLARPDAEVPVLEDAPARGRATLDAWPNPFNPLLNLSGAVAAGGEAALAVYDLGGRRVATLAASRAANGTIAATWDGRDRAGRAMPSGVYLVRLGVGADAATRRVVLAR